MALWPVRNTAVWRVLGERRRAAIMGTAVRGRFGAGGASAWVESRWDGGEPVGWRRVGLALWLAVLVWAAVLLGLHERATLPTPPVLSVQQVANGFAASTIAPPLSGGVGMPLHGRPAPWEPLVDMAGHPFSLAAWHGRVVVLTFINPACRTGCHDIGPVLRAAFRLLGPSAPAARVVAVDVNLGARTPAALRRWWAGQRLGSLGTAVTGSRRHLEALWGDYGVVVTGRGGELQYTPVLYVIDGQGREETLFVTARGPVAVQARVLAAAMRRWMRPPGPAG